MVRDAVETGITSPAVCRHAASSPYWDVSQVMVIGKLRLKYASVGALANWSLSVSKALWCCGYQDHALSLRVSCRREAESSLRLGINFPR